MGEITIRRAAKADHPRLLAIWLDASRAGHSFLGEEVLQAQLVQVRELYLPGADNWLAEDGAPLGFLGLVGSHVGGLFVDPAAHRRGIARRLVSHAAARLGALSVEVYERNQAARTFYASCGFVETGRKERDDEGRPFPLVRLERPA